jgi:hypothetical protein
VNANEKVINMEKKLTPAQIEKAKDIATEWIKKHTLK